jgi:hypothetical protein
MDTPFRLASKVHTCCDGVVVGVLHDIHGMEGGRSDGAQRGVGLLTPTPAHIGGKGTGELHR